jgi:DNA polymerase III subunit delta
MDQGLDRKEILREVGVNPYFLDGLQNQARFFPGTHFPEVFQELLNTDLALKSRGAHPKRIAAKPGV